MHSGLKRFHATENVYMIITGMENKMNRFVYFFPYEPTF